MSTVVDDVSYDPIHKCRWCGMWHGPLCPAVKSIEYFENGMVKRVEFKEAINEGTGAGLAYAHRP